VYAGLRPKEEAAAEAFRASLQYCAITLPFARSAGELKRDHRRKGISLNLGDVIIAAVALCNQLILLTDDVKDFGDERPHALPTPNGIT
jgi:predicted nucleic acid-binding protein